MKTRAEDFAGLTVAMTTPFKNGKIDFDALAKQVEFLVGAGATALSPTGTTGESPTLTHEEQHEVIRKTVEFVAGRAKVLAGTGSNNTEEALSLTRYAAEVGADAALVITPYYNKPTQEGMYLHFRKIAESVDLPICVYNVPGRTGKAIEPETIIRLAEFKNIAMVKEASGSMDAASKIVAATDLTILSGDDSLTLPFMSRRLHYRLLPLCRDTLSLATNPIPVKKAMQLLGRDTGELRLPMTELEPALTERLRRSLVDYGLLAE